MTALVCHVVSGRSGFKGGHGSWWRRPKHKLPVLPAESAERERMDIWYFGIWSSLHLSRTPLLKNRKLERIMHSLLLERHLIVGMHMQDIQAYIKLIINYHYFFKKIVEIHLHLLPLRSSLCTQGPMIYCCWKVADICLTLIPTPPVVC